MVCFNWLLSVDENSVTILLIKYSFGGPGPVAQLVTALSLYAKVVGSVPGQGTYNNQLMNALISGTTN